MIKLELTRDELIESTWFVIDNHPESWAQFAWRSSKAVEGERCGTVGCVAGWICELAGQGKYVTDKPDNDLFQVLVPVEDDFGTHVRAHQNWHAGGYYDIVVGVPVRDRAKRLLGVDDLYMATGVDLFAGCTEVEDIKTAFEILLGRPVSGRNPWLLRKTMEHIEQNPESWNQGTWWEPEDASHMCGTVGCFAGWAAHLDGGKHVMKSNGQPAPQHFVPRPGEHYVQQYRGQDAVILHVRAKNALGLDEFEFNTLASGANTLPMLRRYVDNLCAGRDIHINAGQVSEA